MDHSIIGTPCLSSFPPANLFNGHSKDSSLIDDEKLATFLRIRPVDGLSIGLTPYKVIDSNLLKVKCEEINNNGTSVKKGGDKIYRFSAILDGTDQKSVFNRCCLPLINDVLDGTNAFLFCFGTTSSGKSHTMRGPPDDPGLIPLSLEKIFLSKRFTNEPRMGKSNFNDLKLLDHKQLAEEKHHKHTILFNLARPSSSISNELDSDGSKYVCRISYAEIYNDQVYDLLVPAGRGKLLNMVHDEHQRFYIKELKSIMVSSIDEAIQVYSYGWNNLQKNIRETGLNKNSSRSHSFFNVTIIKFKEEDGELLESQVSHLTLGDLAGSERQNKTHSEGLRMKEGCKINVSLMYLKKCFDQTRLSQKNPNRNFVIPFRDSNLTKFFQPYLSGMGRVWMISNINPAPNLMSETLGTLDFVETASAISANSFRTPNIARMSSIIQRSFTVDRQTAGHIHQLNIKNQELMNENHQLHQQLHDAKLLKEENELLKSRISTLEAGKSKVVSSTQTDGKNKEFVCVLLKDIAPEIDPYIMNRLRRKPTNDQSIQTEKLDKQSINMNDTRPPLQSIEPETVTNKMKREGDEENLTPPLKKGRKSKVKAENKRIKNIKSEFNFLNMPRNQVDLRLSPYIPKYHANQHGSPYVVGRYKLRSKRPVIVELD